MKDAYQDPRPQCSRARTFLLNGTWTMNGQEVSVPFPPESPRSGFHGEVPEVLDYGKRFRLPEDFDQPVVLLHFGAVDQVAEVWLNGLFLGSHRGGYLPFQFDISSHLHREGENVLRVRATDTLSIDLPYGKQRKKRGGMWYTPASGIWGSVWLENVPADYIAGLQITPDLTGIDLGLRTVGRLSGFTAEVWPDGSEEEPFRFSFQGHTGRIDLPEPLLWTPEHPQLYRLRITAGEDTVLSYFALRTIGVGEAGGRKRVFLNGKPIFLHGLLDQGYFEDGIYTPGDFREYERDVLRAKALGFNTLRKHIKIEPEPFYYACDRHGMLVIQDMVNSGIYRFFFETFLPNMSFIVRRDDQHPELDRNRKDFFIAHMKETMELLWNHPCIIVYTIFNEGWGQFESDRLYRLAKEWDPTRLIDSTSGWFAQKESDFDSRHVYFHDIRLRPKERPMLLSECGGFSMGVEGHLFQNMKKLFGYGMCHDTEELTDAVIHMYEAMVLPAVRRGLCGAVYTQLTDVEEEVNGLYTYDRAVCKVKKDRMRALSRKLRRALELAVG